MTVITCSKGHQNPAGANFCFRCGVSLHGLNTNAGGITALQAGSQGLQPGTGLRGDRYLIQYQLGQGGFGRTYLAIDRGRFNERVAIKELLPSIQGTTSLQKAEELFEREAMILYQLQHPQLPRFREFFRDGKQLFLVLDFIEGETYQFLLNERLQKGECFSESEIIQLFRELLPVLSYLHHQGVIHRDISPDNIICRAQDKLPVLIDLGGVKQIALNVASQLTGGQQQFSAAPITRLGKVGYAPDEQMRLGIVSPSSDLYALGVTALVLMTGKQPPDLIDPKTMNWVWNRYLNLSPQFKGILERMLDPQPNKRFQSADEILQRIKAFGSNIRTYPVGNLSQPKTVLSNNSGQGGLFDNSIKVPDEIQGWNWGAFFLPGVWCLTNHVWIGLVAWADASLITCGVPWLTMGIILGVKGNEWAWKSRKWRSIAAFKRHQRMWAIVGFIFAGLFLLLVPIILVLILLGMLVLVL